MTPADRPHVVVLGGPNGAGKTTASEHILRDTLAVDEFVNADIIAKGLSGFAPERTSFAAGRLMLQRIASLAERRADFAFETTLASRSFAPWLRRIQTSGHAIHLVLFWVPDPEFAIERVAERVRKGGHSVPPNVVRRRYHRGIANFRDLYRPIATTWRCYDSSPATPRLVATGGKGLKEEVLDSLCWTLVQRA